MIRRDLSEILRKEMRDPRLAMVTVTSVEVARDFSVAKVFVSAIGTREEKAAALKALQGASGFLRGMLGRMLEIRTIPQLVFRYDTGIERGIRMFEVLEGERKEFAELPGEPESESAPSSETD